jgi:putative sterol carrier protein
MSPENTPASYDDLPGYIAVLRATFDAAATGGRGFVIQYDFTGRVAGVCHATIASGALSVALGPAPAPDVIVTADFDLWRRVLAHQVDGLMAWQEGLFTVTGDMETLMESDLWFRR